MAQMECVINISLIVLTKVKLNGMAIPTRQENQR